MFKSFAFISAASLSEWAKFIKTHQESVFMLSTVVAALFSFLMWVAYRRITSEKWMKYFSWSFGLLSLQYLLLLVNWFSTLHPSLAQPPIAAGGHPAAGQIVFLFVHLISIINNLCAVAAAQDIENQTRLVPRTAWILAATSAATTLYAHFFLSQQSIGDVLLGRSVTSIFSAYCLFKVGFAIFANLSIRRHRRMALGAIAIATVYALVQLAYGASPILAELFLEQPTFAERLAQFDVLLMGFALPLKFFLCGFAYLLVMRFFETLNEVRYLSTGDDQRQDYLSANGVARLIAGKLSDGRPGAEANAADGEGVGGGYVNIVVKLPGEVNKRVVCIPWPNAEPERRAITFDWPAPTRFSRRMVRDTSDVMRSEPEPEESEPYEWEATLPFAGKVMTESERKEFIWVNGDPRTHDADVPYDGDLKAIANVAIIHHGAVIGCLQVARCRFRFSQMAVRQIREIANLLSPAVQSYRELASLDQMSIRFAWKQAEERTYSQVESTQLIGGIIHDIFASLVTRLHMNFGFSSEPPYYVKEEHATPIYEELKLQCDGRAWKEIETTIYADLSPVRLLKKQLSARVTESLSHMSHPTVVDRFIMGNLILAVSEKDYSYVRTPLGFTYLQRKAASTLAADAYLDFARDHYNDLLKGLGKELSRKRLSVAEWFEPINLVLKEAGLLWVVVSQKKRDDRLGDDEGKYILQNFDRFAGKENPIPPIGEIKITHHPLKARYNRTSHVLKLDLRDSDCHLWVGVERPGFGPELDFSSPWRTFLVNFAQIADAALSRIMLPEKFQLHLEAAQLQGVMASYVTTGTVIHQLSNMIQGQAVSIRYLLDAVALQKLVADDNLMKKIHNMNEAVGDMQELFRSLDRITKVDKHRPCQLRDAARHAFKLFRVSLEHRRIRHEMSIADGVSIDVPFNVAALALANLVGNAKDAVDNDGEIKIEAEVNGNYALCRVSDNGRGLPSEVVGVIFEPKNTLKETGSGLGLYLTYHSLMENGAAIELTSTGPAGTVFTVQFPLAKEEGKR